MNDIDLKKTVAFSGHRNITLNADLYDRLYHAIEVYIQHGFDTFLLGMAKGFDLSCGICLLRLKSVYSHIKITPVIPCDNQTDCFSDTEKILYKKILAEAYDIVQTGKSMTPYSMKRRNKFMVDNSSVLICYLQRDRSGTYHTCNYAGKRGIDVLNLSDSGIKFE